MTSFVRLSCQTMTGAGARPSSHPKRDNSLPDCRCRSHPRRRQRRHTPPHCPAAPLDHARPTQAADNARHGAPHVRYAGLQRYPPAAIASTSYPDRSPRPASSPPLPLLKADGKDVRVPTFLEHGKGNQDAPLWQHGHPFLPNQHSVASHRQQAGRRRLRPELQVGEPRLERRQGKPLGHNELHP